MPANQQLLGTTHRLLPVGLGAEDRAATMDRMNRAHTLIRRYEGAVTSVKELVKMCKAEGKKLRLIEDECNDLVESGARKSDVEVEVYLSLDPLDAANDRIVVMRTDAGHEGEVVSSSALTDKQRAEVEKGVLPGFENEPRIPTDMVPELADDPNVAAFVKESTDNEAVASRVLGESATQIGSVLDQIGLIAASYPKDEAQPKRRGRKPKSEQMALPLPMAHSDPAPFKSTDAPVGNLPSEPPTPADESPWNNLPAPGFGASDEMTSTSEAIDQDAAHRVTVEHMDDASEPDEAAPMGGEADPDSDTESTRGTNEATEPSETANDDSESQEEGPPLDEDTNAGDSDAISEQTVAPLPVMVMSISPEIGNTPAPETVGGFESIEPPPTTSRSPESQEAQERAARLLADAREAKREREAKIAAKESGKSKPASDSKPVVQTATLDVEAEAKIRECNLTDSFKAALTRMLVKNVEEAGSITTSELTDKVRDKIKSGVKGEDLAKRLSAIPYVLRCAVASGAKIAPTSVDGKDGWMAKAD